MAEILEFKPRSQAAEDTALGCTCGCREFTLLMEGGARCAKCNFVMPLVWRFDFDPEIHTAEEE